MELLDFMAIDAHIERALEEDIGQYDLTSIATVDSNAECEFRMVTRQDMVMAGFFMPEMVIAKISDRIEIRAMIGDGELVKAGTVLYDGKGAARDILLAERVMLNYLQHLTGVATITRQYVEAVSHTKAKILDTRKTTPLYRMLEKYAVRCGGGQNHRLRLDDGVLIKDNHIAVSGGIKQAVERCRRLSPALTKIEIECDTLEQVQESLQAGVDVIMLDNMDIASLTKAVQIIDRRVTTEASGNVSLDTVADIANTGVDAISVGAITHSAPNIDIGLDIAI